MFEVHLPPLPAYARVDVACSDLLALLDRLESLASDREPVLVVNPHCVRIT